MKGNRIALIVVVALAVVVAAAGIAFATSRTGWPLISGQILPSGAQTDGLMASGFIEAEEVTVAPELGGRVVELLVKEGDGVETGQVLTRLDGTLLEAQIEVVQAALDVAQAGLAQVQAGVRPEQIRQAEAALAQAEAGRDGAFQAWQDVIAIRDNPQDLDAQIVQARAQVAAAEAALAQATAWKDAAEIADAAYHEGMAELQEAKEELQKIPKEVRPSLPGLQLDVHLVPNAYWKSWVGVNTAQAGLDGARAALANLYAIRDNPQEWNAQVDVMEAEYNAAVAAVEMAQAQLDAMRAGATEEEIAIAEAQVEQAQAVLELNIHEGELAAPGAAMLVLGDLDHVTLTVYVPEDKLGQVRVGQEVQVGVDSFPGRLFTGSVVAIANEAEFTPRNVQTQEERVNMVFAVDVRIPNPDHALKPGVPADAVIITQEQ